MKRSMVLTAVALMLGLFATAALAQDSDPVETDSHGRGFCGFLDEDGDGFNDLAPDHDGDGIPNGLDPDYEKPEDGTGLMRQLRREDAGQFGEGSGNMYMYMWSHGYGPGGAGAAHGESFGPNDGQWGPGESTGDGSSETNGGDNGGSGGSGSGTGGGGGGKK